MQGEGTTRLTLDELVAYARTLDNEKDAELIELMLYRVLGQRLTPEAIDKIRSIREHFRARTAQQGGTAIAQFINNGVVNEVHGNREVKQLQAI